MESDSDTRGEGVEWMVIDLDGWDACEEIRVHCFIKTQEFL